MLIGYVADERFLALADVIVDLEDAAGAVTTLRSGARGGIHADVAPGKYRVTLQKDGFGPKTVHMTVDPDRPYHFRLLTNRILGYAWPKWVRSGEKSEFRVHSMEPYRLSLWRYGQEKEFLRVLGWFDEHGPRATQQITPDGDYTQTGVQWNKIGFHSKHHTQFVAGPERSGLYYFHAEGESGDCFTFPWVVAPAKPAARVCVLASSSNWNAYNNFGGRSNYINSTGLPAEPIVYARVDLVRYQAGVYNEWQFPNDAYLPLSFDRPEPLNHVPLSTQVTDPIRGRQSCHVAPAEWRLLGWLEREGFPYDFYSETQLHFGEVPLDAYDVVIVSAHPEYWSRQMLQQINDWVFERGGKFMYLAGNGLNCEIEFLERDIMRCLSHMRSDRESRMANTFESEAALLGVAYTDAGIMTAAPYRVVDPNHWVFAGTGLRAGDTFGEKSLHERIPGGASGHETDKRTPSTPAGAVFLAKGLNPGDGGGEIVYHETASGGAVFSAGSITWPACVLVDENISRITRNVLTRFLGG